MKVIRYTLLGNGKVPSAMVDGGYFIKSNGGQAPQDYDLIGLSLGWSGLEEYKTKLDFENYVKSFASNYEVSGRQYFVQDEIDTFWAKRG